MFLILDHWRYLRGNSKEIVAKANWLSDVGDEIS